MPAVCVLASATSVHFVPACYPGTEGVRGLVEVSTLVAPSLGLAGDLNGRHSLRDRDNPAGEA